MSDTPFLLPDRPPVRRMRQVDGAAPQGTERTQPMRGFDPQYTDIVDYIVGITDEIWGDRAVGRIYDTYDAACTVYSSTGIVRSVEEVVAGTLATLNAYPEYETQHLNVAWSGDEDAGFYTSHLGFARSTNLGRSGWGPATGKRTARFFVADCISKHNRIHTEWLVRDSGAAVRQLGFDIHALARDLSGDDASGVVVTAPATLASSQPPRTRLDEPADTPEGWARNFIHDLWNLKRFDWLGRYYAPDAVIHAAGEREAQGLRAISALLVQVQAALPDAIARVQHVCHADETDGVILAIRWLFEGSTAAGGVLGDCPAGRPVFMMASSHLRFQAGKIVEEWMIFDELGMLVQAYRP